MGNSFPFMAVTMGQNSRQIYRGKLRPVTVKAIFVGSLPQEETKVRGLANGFTLHQSPLSHILEFNRVV